MSESVSQVRFVPGETAPMSPHLQVWKFTVTMAASITHRATGVANAVGMLALTAWIGSAAHSEAAFGAVSGFLGSGIGRVILFGFTLSVMFHLVNGLRYLFADAGMGMGKDVSKKTAWAAYLLAPLLSLIIFWAAYALAGGN